MSVSARTRADKITSSMQFDTLASRWNPGRDRMAEQACSCWLSLPCGDHREDQASFTCLWTSSPMYDQFTLLTAMALIFLTAFPARGAIAKTWDDPVPDSEKSTITVFANASLQASGRGINDIQEKLGARQVWFHYNLKLSKLISVISSM